MIASASQATEVAVEFLKRYYPFIAPVKVKKENELWLVQADVGAVTVRLATVVVDAQTGEILSFEAETSPKLPKPPGVRSATQR
ncbi:MAG: hypothetical protein HY532_08465 [Chloroflexi bacterium]|nr:hypothetical protein [Chloroflexota bacterium]